MASDLKEVEEESFLSEVEIQTIDKLIEVETNSNISDHKIIRAKIYNSNYIMSFNIQGDSEYTMKKFELIYKAIPSNKHIRYINNMIKINYELNNNNNLYNIFMIINNIFLYYLDENIENIDIKLQNDIKFDKNYINKIKDIFTSLKNKLNEINKCISYIINLFNDIINRGYKIIFGENNKNLKEEIIPNISILFKTEIKKFEIFESIKENILISKYNKIIKIINTDTHIYCFQECSYNLYKYIDEHIDKEQYIIHYTPMKTENIHISKIIFDINPENCILIGLLTIVKKDIYITEHEDILIKTDNRIDCKSYNNPENRGSLCFLNINNTILPVINIHLLNPLNNMSDSRTMMLSTYQPHVLKTYTEYDKSKTEITEKTANILKKIKDFILYIELIKKIKYILYDKDIDQLVIAGDLNIKYEHLEWLFGFLNEKIDEEKKIHFKILNIEKHKFMSDYIIIITKNLDITDIETIVSKTTVPMIPYMSPQIPNSLDPKILMILQLIQIYTDINNILIINPYIYNFLMSNPLIINSLITNSDKINSITMNHIIMNFEMLYLLITDSKKFFSIINPVKKSKSIQEKYLKYKNKYLQTKS